jgi:hypothetical protein
MTETGYGSDYGEDWGNERIAEKSKKNRFGTGKHYDTGCIYGQIDDIFTTDSTPTSITYILDSL